MNTENRLYVLPGDSTEYIIKKINKYYYRFVETELETGGMIYANCGTGQQTRREALRGLVLA